MNMIRKSETRDIDALMAVWLSANLDAHAFVPETYWKQHIPEVREQLLQAEIWVYETDGILQGFAGLQGDYLAGIFVKKEARSAGIGHQLLEHIKARHPGLSLHVYQKNSRAVKFYKREGFSVLTEGTDADTGEKDYTMGWNHSLAGL